MTQPGACPPVAVTQYIPVPSGATSRRASDLMAPSAYRRTYATEQELQGVLLAVGADYNLLLVSRMKEEFHAGLHTGIIRSMAGTGSVVTSAGLVFAFTMMGMAVSNLIVIGQVGTTIGLGLLFDTLVVRSLMTPSLAALLGRWFWWPQRIRLRPVPKSWPKVADDQPASA